jgi:hypothetical protein
MTSKYAPFGAFLRSAKVDEISLSFDRIEKILGFALPPSQDNYAWWSNNADNNVMTKVWLDAGWRVKHIRLKEREIVFHRDPDPRTDAVGTAAIELSQLSAVSRGVLSVLAKRSNRTITQEAIAVLEDALK